MGPQKFIFMVTDSLDEFENVYLRNTIESLRDHNVDKYVQLPQIAVMGDTSSGKSSLLSAISGIQFPANDKLTTRCPTQLILSQGKQFRGSAKISRYDKSLNKESISRTLSNMKDVTKVIEDFTKILVEEGQNISDDSIVIDLKGPNLPNLTLTDLPGLVRTVQDGEDQAIIKRIQQLVKRYLVHKRTVILAVAPANVDFHNSEILQAASEADPEGDRTICIITKPDLVDEGAEDSVIDLLLNRKRHLKLGYHAVKCRGQKDLNNGMTIQEGLRQEIEFFETTEPWNQVDCSLWGVKQLKGTLVGLLEDRIRAALPVVREEICNQLEKCNVDLKELGPTLETTSERRNLYSKILDNMKSNIGFALKGAYSSCDSRLFHEKENRLRAILIKSDLKFSNILEESKNWEELVENEEFFPQKDILNQIRDSRGDQLSIFASYDVFCILFTEWIKNWENPTKALLESYENELTAFCKFLVNHSTKHEALKNKIESKFIALLEDLVKKSRNIVWDSYLEEQRPSTLNDEMHKILANLRFNRIKTELEKYRSTKDPGHSEVYIDTVYRILSSVDIGENVSPETREANDMRVCLASYIPVACKRFVDNVPKLLNQHLLNPLMKKFSEELQFSDKELDSILVEPKGVENHRKDLKKKQQSLESAMKLFA
eukprot:NODE_28_length_38599_cov_0.791792.p4 type:complete len:660 gc:universal NODE_28_length_38599_cov_0.791792:37662-35683(-)